MCSGDAQLPEAESRVRPAPCNLRRLVTVARSCAEDYENWDVDASLYQRILQVPSKSNEAKTVDFLTSVAVACLKGSQRLDDKQWAVSLQAAPDSVHMGQNPRNRFLALNFKSFPRMLIMREKRQYQRLLQILEEGPGAAPFPLAQYVNVVAWLCKSFHGFMCHVGPVSPEVQANIQPLVHTPDIVLMTPSCEQRVRAFHRLKDSGHPTKFAFYGAPLEFWHSILRNEISAESSMEILTHQEGGTCKASHGFGVYLADRLQHAVRYCSYDPSGQSRSLDLVDGWCHSEYGKIFCVAVVEYVDRPDTATHYRGHSLRSRR